jgi:putative colanic acid biosynthesis UDP-glucose lipid carrier transferase
MNCGSWTLDCVHFNMSNSTASSKFTGSVFKKSGIPVKVVHGSPEGWITEFRIPLEKKSNAIFKRTIDVMFSILLLLLVFIWILPVIAIMIRLDSKGPVFFLQKRNKRMNRVFTCIKFRTMIPNDECDVLPADVDDKRITRMGRFMRKYYLDELPQLLNVLWGDMSLIGPRPYMMSDNLRYAAVVEHYHIRCRVKPGITGPAQLLGYGGDVSEHSRIIDRSEMDLLYVKNWSVILDLEILFRTFLKAFLNRKINCFRMYNELS